MRQQEAIFSAELVGRVWLVTERAPSVEAMSEGFHILTACVLFLLSSRAVGDETASEGCVGEGCAARGRSILQRERKDIAVEMVGEDESELSFRRALYSFSFSMPRRSREDGSTEAKQGKEHRVVYVITRSAFEKTT